MNFLNKARKKAEELAREIQIQASSGGGFGAGTTTTTTQGQGGGTTNTGYSSNVQPGQSWQYGGGGWQNVNLQHAPPAQWNQQPQYQYQPYTPPDAAGGGHGNHYQPSPQFAPPPPPPPHQVYHQEQQQRHQQFAPSLQAVSPQAYYQQQQNTSPPFATHFSELPSTESHGAYHGYQPPRADDYQSPIQPPAVPPNSHDQPMSNTGSYSYDAGSQLSARPLSQSEIPNFSTASPSAQQPTAQNQPHTSLTPTTSEPPVTTDKCLAPDSVLALTIKTYCLIPTFGIGNELFGVCNSCYHANILPTSLAGNFTQTTYSDPETRFTCDFSIPRVRNTFYRQCIPQSTVQPLIDFLRLMQRLEPCEGAVISSPGPMWVSKNEAIPHLAVCGTCFEVFLKGGEFERFFEEKTYPDSRDWTCDLAAPFFRRSLLMELRKPSPDFDSTSSEFNTRFEIPSCSGEGRPTSIWERNGQALMFTAAEGKTGNVCAACYCDYLSDSALENAFIPANLDEDGRESTTCDLASAYSKSAMAVAIKHSDDEIWRAAVGVVGKTGPCFGRKGVSEIPDLRDQMEKFGDMARWYHVKDFPLIEICPSCFWTVVTLYQASSMFVPITRPLREGIDRICFLQPSNAPPGTPITDVTAFESTLTVRARRLRTAIDFAHDSNGDFSHLISEASSISALPPPCGGIERGFKRPSGRKWFGRIAEVKGSEEDCTIVMCEECHIFTVRNTALEAAFSNDLTSAAYSNEGDSGFACQVYSHRARAELRSAAERGDLASFARYWNKRDALRMERDRWTGILQRQTQKMMVANQQQSLNMMVKMNRQSNALMKIGGAGMVEAAMSDPGVRWGNSQIGYDSYTQGRAEAEQEWQDASNMSITPSGQGDVVAETQRLVVLGLQAEEAFKAYE